MKLTDIMGLLGGLALFLYGMQMMSQGLENAAGDKMKQILEKLTSNRLLGVLVGAVITAVIQSSSATTVMVVGFVNSGMMTLTQAIWIIMGANIGTTITGQLIALDVGVLAPFIAFVGVAILVFLKNERIHYIGNIVAGLGILFIGMDMMSSSMAPLSESQEFVGLLTRFENPILGILAGMIFTAIHPVVVCFRRNSAGSCCQRNCYIEQCSIYIVWAKYRNVYHSTSCICRRKPQCEKDDNRALYI